MSDKQAAGCVQKKEVSGQETEEAGREQEMTEKVESCSWPLCDLSEPINLPKELEALERYYIDRALELSGGNHSKAAKLLGCSRFALRRRLGNGDDL